MAVNPGGAAWPPGGEPEGAPGDKPSPALEASSGPVTPGRRAPKSFDQEEVDFLTQLDEDLKDYKDKGKAATPCSDQEAVDFLAQLDEDLKDYKDKGKAATPCSDQEVVDFLAQLDEDLKDYKDKGRSATVATRRWWTSSRSWTRTSKTTRTRTRRRPEPPTVTGATFGR